MLLSLLHIGAANKSLFLIARFRQNAAVTKTRKNQMPFIRTTVHPHTSLQQRQGIADGIHRALVDSIGMPEDELFSLIADYEPHHFFYSRTFNGMARSDRLVVIELTMRRGRSDAMKRALYAAIAANLAASASIAPDDVFIFTHENDYSDWSVGQGRLAMTLMQQPGLAAAT
jgi:phenylpyruvate tautomerase PptA (4-oxalocrotonate tautomerase family)